MRKTAYSAFFVLLSLSVTIGEATAQRGRRGGDRGGDRGERAQRFGGRSFGGDRGTGRSFGGRSFGGDRGGRSSGGRSFGRSGFDPSQMGARISQFMDRNKNGRIDADEMQRLPKQVQDRLRQSGIDPSKGISVSDFSKRASMAWQAQAREREDARSRRDRERESRDSDGKKSSTSKSAPGVFKQSERKRITQMIPKEYEEGDANADGQIALFEWAAWRRSDMFEFFELDSNQDGFLTPKELLVSADSGGDGEKKDSEPAGSFVTIKRDRLAVSGRSGSSRIRTTGSRSKSSSSSKTTRTPEQRDRDTGRAKYYFQALDRDKDGTVSEGEWERSRMVRGMFQRAGVATSAMNESAFVATYLKVAEKNAAAQSKDGGEGNRGGWGGRTRGGGRGGFGGNRGGGFGGNRGGDRGSSRGGDRGGDRRSFGRRDR